MVVAQIHLSELLHRILVFGAGGHRIHEEVEHLPRQVSRSGRTIGDNSNHVFAAEVSASLPGRPEINRLTPVIVGIRSGRLKRVRRPSLIIPSGEGSRDFLHILLGVVRLAGDNVSNAHREELLELAAEILIGSSKYV